MARPKRRGKNLLQQKNVFNILRVNKNSPKQEQKTEYNTGDESRQNLSQTTPKTPVNESLDYGVTNAMKNKIPEVIQKIDELPKEVQDVEMKMTEPEVIQSDFNQLGMPMLNGQREQVSTGQFNDVNMDKSIEDSLPSRRARKTNIVSKQVTPQVQPEQKVNNPIQDVEMANSIQPIQGNDVVKFASDPWAHRCYIKKNDDDEEMDCDICLNDFYDEETNDNLVMCDKCNVAVHMTCYGQDLLVKGKPCFPTSEEWFCRRCVKLMAEHRKQLLPNSGAIPVKASDIECRYCFDVKGALVQTNLGWAHITCVNWIPEIWFADENKTKIETSVRKEQRAKDGVLESRRHLFCTVCKKRNTAVCIQCDYQNCTVSFHVRCAINAELIKDWEEMNKQRENDEDYNCFVFCKQHIKVGNQKLEKFGKEGIAQVEQDQIPTKVARKTTKKKAQRTQGNGLTIQNHIPNNMINTVNQDQDQEEFEPSEEHEESPSAGEKDSEEEFAPTVNGHAPEDENAQYFAKTKKRKFFQSSPQQNRSTRSKPQKRSPQIIAPAKKIINPKVNNLQVQNGQNSILKNSGQAQDPMSFFNNFFAQNQDPKNGGVAGMNMQQAMNEMAKLQKQIGQGVNTQKPPPQATPDMQQQQQQNLLQMQAMFQNPFAAGMMGGMPMMNMMQNGQMPNGMPNGQMPNMQNGMLNGQMPNGMQFPGMPQQQQQIPQQQQVEKKVEPVVQVNKAARKRVVKGSDKEQQQLPNGMTNVNTVVNGNQMQNGNQFMNNAVAQPQTSPQTATPVASPPKQDANTDMYLVDQELGTLIGLKGMRATRADIQKRFIQFAIQNSLVNAENHHYEIQRHPALFARMKVQSVMARDIFKFLKRSYLQKL